MGSLQLLPSAILSLTAIKISESIAACSVCTYPMPIALFSEGDCVPDVTLPIKFPLHP